MTFLDVLTLHVSRAAPTIRSSSTPGDGSRIGNSTG
jgi:hypothetical protein